MEDRHSRSDSGSAGNGYTVQRGDTLYSIAFRYGLDYRRLAAANRIALPYTIYPGQRLQLREADPPLRSASTSSSRPVAAPGGPSAASAGSPAPAAAPASKPPVTRPSSRPVTTPGTTRPAAVAAPVGGPVKTWRWPTSGKVVRRYSSTVHKGIDISGNLGDAIEAVAAGQVVYAGTGIVGLGELIIIKHNDVYLSAYGHNNRLLVAEGTLVKAGQKIAEKGNSGTDKVQLHFEIRKEGKPIDPLRLLPRR
ncbi:peptidoglycan DD-metalloendopeptidase family protein [Seongchinamella sediminis]|uniref:peptidoglycan DD-metalloendopeptidase family protein n=1 Tax=Seongchinamella sediminis TaxID=2283635 RepID=UPI001EEF78B9|nr:peptidoglycan DD-metalloendopeptidase family protein [Seongchinamella sediminis]